MSNRNIFTISSKTIIDIINKKYNSWFNCFTMKVFEGEYELMKNHLHILESHIVCDFSTSNDHIILSYYNGDSKYKLNVIIYRNYNCEYYLVVTNNLTSERKVIAKIT